MCDMRAPQDHDDTRPVKRGVKSALLFATSGLYGLLVLLIAYLDTRSPETGRIALYLYGLAGGIGLLLISHIYVGIERNRRIIAEVLEKSSDAHAITDPEGKVIYANLLFRQVSKNVANIKNFTEAFDGPIDMPDTLSDMRNKSATGDMVVTEILLRPRGEPVWTQVTCRPVRGSKGFLHWRFDDITKRHRMEVAILKEQEKLKDFTDSAPVGLFAVDGQGVFLFANSTFLDILGLHQDELIGVARLHDFLVTSPGTAAKPYDVFDDGSTRQQGETLMKGANGRSFRANISLSVSAGEDGDVIARASVQDLTVEDRMRQALSESEGRFQRLFEEAPVGICLLDANNTISEANQTLLSMLHISAEKMNGQPLLDHIGEEAQTRVRDWLAKLPEKGRVPPPVEAPLKGRRGIIVQLFAQRFTDGKHFVVHFIDLTEQKNLERQFAQSQKMQAVGQLAGGIAHDFNNLLTAMIGFADLLLLRHKPGDPSFADITQIKQNANRAASLVRQLLAFSRQQTLQARVLDLTDVLTELSHLLRRLIGTNIELVISHGSHLGLIKADQGQMEQVLINLAVNARDAMQRGGALLIRTGNFTNVQILHLNNEEMLPPGDWVTVAVEDSGTGISPDVLPHIFEPFFTTKDVGAGTGLGLATAHGIIHQTGGYITVNSVQSKGTTFTIYLPAHKETAQEAASAAPVVEEKSETADLTGSARILLVEDEDAVRIFSTRALSNKGYQVADAASGKAALQILEDKKFEPELLITDVMMPEMDGTTLAKIVRGKYPHIKIVFISGYAEDKFKEHLGDGVHFLPKPFTLKQLASKVKEIIEG